MTADSPERFLTLATAWVGHSGGVTVNRELSIALAELGHDVYARVSVPSPGHPLVHVQGLDPVPGITDERGQLLRADGLPRNVDVIIGHGRFTGGAASYLREKFYPRARVVHITHALTDELDRLRGDPQQATQHAETERLLISKSDLAVGVGPLLTDDTARLARMCEHPPPVREMIPGVQLGRPAAPDPLQKRVNLLLFGRADDPLKGVDTAVGVLVALRHKGVDAQLTILGAKPGALKAGEEMIRKEFGQNVKLKPFTSDRSVIEAEIRGADLMLMASRHDGFGLTATEAAGYGLPVLVPSNIGAGMFLSDPKKVPPELGLPSVVQVPAGAHSAPADVWADRAEALIQDMARTRHRALALREHLGNHFTWKHTAQALTEELNKLGPKDPPSLGKGQQSASLVNTRAKAGAASPRKAEGLLSPEAETPRNSLPAPWHGTGRGDGIVR
ncbi:glycosyltransferase family 4 protein [Nocardiopsis sp. NPDC050513]|uniref:glycosyltransferase family 4 protein n=1 Tax=Nocardiopsis sp. NPDC050513 TaxID=3364338 RepID=UPI0037AFDCC8